MPVTSRVSMQLMNEWRNEGGKDSTGWPVCVDGQVSWISAASVAWCGSLSGDYCAIIVLLATALLRVGR